jgi:hypothetical protein
VSETRGLSAKPVLRRILGFGVLGVVALGLVWAGCQAGPDEHAAVQEEDPGSGPDVLAETRRADRLDAFRKVLFWEVAKRSEIASDLLAGRLTLFEAAAGFRAVRQVRARYQEPGPLPFPGRPEEEQLCRQVLGYAETRLHGEPARAAVVARLHQQLQQHLELYGAVQLPASPDLDHPRF